jgi:hypothetical protein
MDGKIGGKRRRGRRYKQLVDEIKEKRRYWNFKEQALDPSLLRYHLGRGYGAVPKRTT